jgi:hypothetical protein
MKTFIVHIYTCEKNDPRNLVGVVEEVGSEVKKAFINPDDLLKIMNHKDTEKENEDIVFS